MPQQPCHATPRPSDTGHCPNLSDPLSHHLQPKKPSFEFLCMMRGDNTGPEQPAESLPRREWRMEARALRLHQGLMHPLGLFHQHGSRISCGLRKAAAASRPHCPWFRLRWNLVSAKSIQPPSFTHGLTLRLWGCVHSLGSTATLCTSFIQGQKDAGTEESEKA